ncbi:hypothetical protein [Nonomuraea zeae]|uniref:Uncharacterized protein n=1 Tax=Nonomuraea zeae TaxID=1642303 RepID=A0A5S4G9N9_9ACTN|nr:hypothetical protein [Nonomuraea zeae]TMR29234.1 hypothetical protein ETD85_33000 [Nonomuraea zeae]
MIIKPPGWPFMSAVSAVGCLVLYWAGVPHWYTIEIIFVLFFLGGPLLAIWVIRCGLASRQGPITGRLDRWLPPWYLVAGIAVALITDAPFQARFAISKPSLDAYAKTVTAEGPQDSPCRWVGLYRVCYAFTYTSADSDEHVPGSAALIAEEWAIHSNTRFLLLPVGVPEETYDDTFRHLTGHWYGWHGWDKW